MAAAAYLAGSLVQITYDSLGLKIACRSRGRTDSRFYFSHAELTIDDISLPGYCAPANPDYH
jgi:hypothetical protein